MRVAKLGHKLHHLCKGSIALCHVQQALHQSPQLPGINTHCQQILYYERKIYVKFYLQIQ